MSTHSTANLWHEIVSAAAIPVLRNFDNPSGGLSGGTSHRWGFGPPRLCPSGEVLLAKCDGSLQLQC